jgi:hypothetical protein
MKSKKQKNFAIASKTTWHVPNWRKKGAYPREEKIGLAQWKWEFLRRRPGYLQDWLTYAPEAYEQEKKEYEEYPFSTVKAGKKTLRRKKEPPLPPDHPDCTVEMPGCVEKYGIPWLMNPDNSNPETLWVFVFARPLLQDGTIVGDECERDVFGRRLFLSKTEVALLFDLSCVPIEQQMAKLMKMFPLEMSICDRPPEKRIFGNLAEYLLWPNEDELEYVGKIVGKKLAINYKRHQPQIFPRPNHSHEFVVVLNLAFTFEHQWTFVKTELQSLQKDKAIQKRRVNTKAWTKFLQVLDARASNETFLEIGKFLYPSKNLSYSELAAQAEKDFTYAKRIRDHFPF